MLLVLFVSLVGSAGASFCDPSPQWPRSFAEEFDGTKLNTSRWSVFLENSNGQCGFGIGRYGRCDADNVYLEDGSLVLRSDRNHSCDASAGCFNYSSGGVTSRDKATWSVADGAGFRLCINALLPGGGASPGAGTGIWPAHWMMPNLAGPGVCDPDEGEIDILEMVDGNGQACGTYHWQTTWPASNCSYPVGT
jgi:beta-glucanase (GH16 family)